MASLQTVRVPHGRGASVAISRNGALLKESRELESCLALSKRLHNKVVFSPVNATFWWGDATYRVKGCVSSSQCVAQGVEVVGNQVGSSFVGERSCRSISE